MKKILAILLVLCFVFAFVACGDGETSGEESKSSESATSGNTSAADSKDTSAAESKDESSKAQSSEEPSEAESSEDVTSEDNSEVDPSQDDTSSEDPAPEVVFTNKFITWKGSYKTGMTTERITDSTSLPLSKINEEVVAGDVGLFTREFGSTIRDTLQDYKEFAIGVFEYDHSIFSYKLVSMSEVGAGNAEQAIPEDGYVLAIYKTYADKAKAMAAAAGGDDIIFFPHGITINRGLDVTIRKAGTAPTLDGNVSAAEYGNAVWSLNPDNHLINYAQFESGKYYATAEVYMTYDDEYLYLGVVVDSPYHYNTLKQDEASKMWQYECIQVNTSALPADSDYILEHWDNVVDGDAVNKGVVRQYGFAANGENDTIQCLWMGDSTLEAPNSKCLRDADNQKTYYEAAIPFSSIGKGDYAVTAAAGTRIGVSVSINSTNQEDTTKNVWKNIILRDGGGIISVNDWTKVPVITLG